jgi:very-short-patch-repair endonuclease
MYISERLTTGAIAAKFRCSDEHIRRKLISCGIKRRQHRFGSGEQNPAYKDGSSVGEYKRLGWNPWNKGKTKETDQKVREVAKKISKALQNRGLGFKAWTTKQDAINGLHLLASALRSRENRKYKRLLSQLGNGWQTEFFHESFVFKRRNGSWSGIVTDLANPSTKQIIEVDDRSHSDPKQTKLDRKRDKFLSRLGWKVRRIKVG